jgi:hypothetical protein
MRTEKKTRLQSRADKGLETSFLDEKVCLGKQNRQYSDGAAPDYRRTAQSSFSDSTIIATNPPNWAQPYQISRLVNTTWQLERILSRPFY